jgi:ketosteroid isomerase-like protein
MNVGRNAPSASMGAGTHYALGAAETLEGRDMSPDLVETIEQYHRALDAFVTGDPEPQKKMWSRRDDATLANPLGPPARGWNQVEEALERAASQLRDGEPVGRDSISEYVTADLAYSVEIERSRMKVGEADEIVPVSLRVTTIFRREDDEWKVAHRHADPITAPRPIESVLER